MARQTKIIEVEWAHIPIGAKYGWYRHDVYLRYGSYGQYAETKLRPEGRPHIDVRRTYFIRREEVQRWIEARRKAGLNPWKGNHLNDRNKVQPHLT
jgi:hypothetical protein